MVQILCAVVTGANNDRNSDNGSTGLSEWISDGHNEEEAAMGDDNTEEAVINNANSSNGLNNT